MDMIIVFSSSRRTFISSLDTVIISTKIKTFNFQVTKPSIC